MGCEQSHPERTKIQFSAASNTLPTTPEGTPLLSIRQQLEEEMGNPPSFRSPLHNQHERLILELLPFKDPQVFREWLHGPFVRGAWQEYCRDYLARHPDSPECDKAQVSQAAKEAVSTRNPKYLLYHPEKDDWSPEDHVIRFIAVVVGDNVLLKGLWSELDWKRQKIEISKALYEVLSFLRSTEFGGIQNPPGYEASLLR